MKPTEASEVEQTRSVISRYLVDEIMRVISETTITTTIVSATALNVKSTTIAKTMIITMAD
eukprot:7358866-Karenia_brevis.AAC.1